MDDQPEIYTVEFLHNAKISHEHWAANKMTERYAVAPIVLVKAPGEDKIPLTPVLTGEQVWGIVARADLRYFHPVEGVDRAAAAACDALLDTVRDWGEIATDVELDGFAAIREARCSLQGLLEEVWEAGLFVYGRRLIRTITSGIGKSAPVSVGQLAVLAEGDVTIAVEEGGPRMWPE